MQVIVHIGAPKAGSTALQQALARDAAALQAMGICYPQDSLAMARRLSGHFRNDRAQLVPAVRRRFANLDEVRQSGARAWETLEQRIRRDKPSVTLLSSEHFLLLDDKPGFIARLRALFDRVVLLGYLRDPVALYVSAIDQVIRGGTRLSALPLPGQGQTGVRAQVEAFRALVGPDNLILRNVARANLAGGDVALDFYAQVGRLTGRDLSALAPAPKANESLAAVATLWLLAQNEDFPAVRGFSDPGELASWQARQKLLSRLAASPELAGLPKLKMAHPLLEAAVLAANRADGLWLNAECLAGQLPLPIGPEGPLPPPDMLRAGLRDWLLGQMNPADLPVLMPVLLPAEAERSAPTQRGKGKG